MKLASQITKINLQKNKNVSVEDEKKKVFNNFFDKFKKNPLGTIVQLVTGKLDLTTSTVPPASASKSIFEKLKEGFNNIIKNITDGISNWLSEDTLIGKGINWVKDKFSGGDDEEESTVSSSSKSSSSSKKSNVSADGVSVVKRKTDTVIPNYNRTSSKASTSSMVVMPMSSRSTVSISDKTFDTDSFNLSNSVLIMRS